MPIIGFLIILVCSAFAFGQANLSFSRNARTYETQNSTLVMKGMANSCLAIRLIPDGLPCNPAMTPLALKPSFNVEFQLSNGYAALENVQKLLNNNLNQEVIDFLFTQGQIMQIEAMADLSFRSRYINARYIPMAVKGFSVVRNEANPDVDLVTVEEKSIVVQSGYEVFRNFYAGLQLRGVSRKFIKQRFKLTALATQVGQEILKPKSQNNTYIEPGITYFFDHSWKPRISAMLVNSGFISEYHSEMDTPVEGQYGIAISPPISWGSLDVNLDYSSMSFEEEGLEKLRLGGLYRYGSMYLTGGIDSRGVSGGVYYGLDKINAGIIYSTTQISNQGESFYTQTVYVQLGWQI